MRAVFVLLLSGLYLPATAQWRVVTGRIIGEDSTGIPFATVLVAGTNTGTVANADGNYRITVIAGKDTLMFFALGYLNKRLPVGSSHIINVVLIKNGPWLPEPPVRYDKKKKKRRTGRRS